MANSSSNILNNRKNGLRPTWANIAVVVLFAAAFSGGVMMVGGYREKVKNLEDDNKQISERLHEVEKWQRDWPRDGELMMDVGQNKDLLELFRRMKLLEEIIE